MPPHCLPSRQVTVSIGAVEPLVAAGFTAEFPLAAAVFRKQHLGTGAREQGQPEARARGRSNSRVSRRGRSLAGPGIASWLGSRATTFKAPEGAVLESLAHRAALCRAVCQPQAVGVGGFIWEDVAWCVLVRDTWRNEAAVLFLFAVENEAGLQLDASRQSVRHDKGYEAETHPKLVM